MFAPLNLFFSTGFVEYSIITQTKQLSWISFYLFPVINCIIDSIYFKWCEGLENIKNHRIIQILKWGIPYTNRLWTIILLHYFIGSIHDLESSSSTEAPRYCWKSRSTTVDDEGMGRNAVWSNSVSTVGWGIFFCSHTVI